MKLFLASALDKTIQLVLDRLPKIDRKYQVLFVANAAEPYEGDKWWVESDRKAFIDNGFDVVEIDLSKISKDEFISYSKNADILHVCGGSPLYFLSLVNKNKELKNCIINIIKKEELIYTGTSTGSMIMANSLEPDKHSKLDEEETELAESLSDFSGFGLVDFLIMPHCNQLEFADSNKDVVEHMHKYSIPFIMIHDHQLVFVENNKFEILSV
ncbi:hypothetical protein D4R87_01600 [bacterium]|nr:MAG: hypothetical protein D4R87_01600 [bacterium]